MKTDLPTPTAMTPSAQHAAARAALAESVGPGVLFVSNTGRAACALHGGAYLEANLAASALAQEVRTPLDHWIRVTPEDNATIAAECGDEVVECERCVQDRA